MPNGEGVSPELYGLVLVLYLLGCVVGWIAGWLVSRRKPKAEAAAT